MATEDASLAPGRGQTTLLDDAPACDWCGGIIPATSPTGRKKRTARFCSKRCRQSSWRFGQAGPDWTAGHGEPLRLAYADPPYPGFSHRYYREHPEYAGEVDHRELIEQLEGFDGWALSTSPRAVPLLIELLLERELEWWRDYRVGIWTKPAPPSKARRAKSAYEPVIVRGGRPRAEDAPHLVDWVHAAQPRDWPSSGVGRQTGRVVGIKPAEFSWWVFNQLGAQPQLGDTLADLFPGSGAVGEAWRRYVAAAGELDASRLETARPDASLPSTGATGLGELADASLEDLDRQIA